MDPKNELAIAQLAELKGGTSSIGQR